MKKNKFKKMKTTRHCLTDYDIKLLLGFNESLKGNRQFDKIFIDSGFPELAALSAAIHSDTDALYWLLNNGFPEFGILSNAIDGEDNAIAWLERYRLDFLSKFAAACRQDVDALKWFADNDLKVFLMIITTIQDILKFQSWDASDWHKLRRS